MFNWIKTSFIYKPFLGLLAAVLWTNFASAQVQNGGVIDAGTTLVVRTNEDINATNAMDNRFFSGVVDQDVPNRRGSVAIPRGSEVQLVVKDISNGQVALDVDSVMVNGQIYGIETADTSIDTDRRDGIGANSRTGKYVGGGALIGAVIGAIVGGGKGAAIGAGAGAAAGAGTQVLTRGRRVSVPAESLLTFQLEQPLRVRPAGLRDSDYGYGSSSWTPAYRQGVRDGQADLQRNVERNPRNNSFTSLQDRRDYIAGYHEGRQRDASIYNNGRYGGVDNRAGNRGYYGPASIQVMADKRVTWQAPVEARVWVVEDNKPAQPFAEAPSGSQIAPWISNGHRYVFILRDANGSELARDELDLRQFSGNSRGDNRRYTPAAIPATIQVQSNNLVTWQAPVNARVWAEVDNKPAQPFAEAPAGSQSQMAPWITRGHLYVFILRDMNGSELAREVVDLRQPSAPRYGR